jgi:hypothetical protein
VDVVRHNDVRVEDVTLAVEMLKGASYDLSDRRLAKQATAVTFIQPALALGRKTLFIFGFSGLVPRLGMMLEPDLALLCPSNKQCLRQRISQPKSDRIGCPLLPPMREIATRYL